MTSYQKLKAKNQELLEDLHNAIMYPDTQTGKRVKMKWHVYFNSDIVEWANKRPEGAQINFKGLIAPIIPKKNRCCGRCDGVNDECVADMICEEHTIMGCEICFGNR